jgi:hypothetical protein
VRQATHEFDWRGETTTLANVQNEIMTKVNTLQAAKDVYDRLEDLDAGFAARGDRWMRLRTDGKEASARKTCIAEMQYAVADSFVGLC